MKWLSKILSAILVLAVLLSGGFLIFEYRLMRGAVRDETRTVEMFGLVISVTKISD